MECKLKLIRLASDTKETASDGIVDTTTVRLQGYDDRHYVEWTLTLKTKDDELPPEYARVIGQHIGDSVVATLGRSAQQTELEGGR